MRLTLPAAGLGPLETTVTATDTPGTYAGSLNIPLEGEWTVDVVTRTSKYEEPITTVEITIPHTSDGRATPDAGN